MTRGTKLASLNKLKDTLKVLNVFKNEQKKHEVMIFDL